MLMEDGLAHHSRPTKGYEKVGGKGSHMQCPVGPGKEHQGLTWDKVLS